MRYHLRTLLILLAILPPLLAVGWWKYSAWREEQEQRARYLQKLSWMLCPPSPLPLALPGGRTSEEHETFIRATMAEAVARMEAAPQQPKAPAKAGE